VSWNEIGELKNSRIQEFEKNQQSRAEVRIAAFLSAEFIAYDCSTPLTRKKSHSLHRSQNL